MSTSADTIVQLVVYEVALSFARLFWAMLRRKKFHLIMVLLEECAVCVRERGGGRGWSDKCKVMTNTKH